MNKIVIKILIFSFISNLLCSSCKPKEEELNIKQQKQGPKLSRKMTGEQSWKLTCTKNEALDSSFEFDTWSDQRISFTGEYYQIEDREFSDPECKNLLLTHRQLGVLKKENGLNLTEPKVELEAWRHFIIPNRSSPRFEEIVSFLEKQCGFTLGEKIVMEIDDESCQFWFEEDFEPALHKHLNYGGKEGQDSFQLSTGSKTYVYKKEKPRKEIDEQALLNQ